MNYYDSTGNLNRYTAASDGAETLDQSSDRIGSEMDNAVGVARRADFASEMQIRQTRVNNRDNQRTDRIGKSIACRLAAARRVRLAMTRQSKQITQLDGSNEGILYDRAGQALQMPPDVDGDWSEYYRLVWDAWGRLVQVKDGSLATVAAYAYDGTTRRITKTVGGTTIHCYYNDRWKAIEEREGSSSDASRQYLWGARPNHRDELVRQDRDTAGGGTLDERLYCLMDYYDPIAMTDASGDVVERYEFSAFGLRTVMNAAWVTLADSAHAVEFAFHGQFLDEETGYYNYGYRYYSPQIGRWLSKDPIEERGGNNLYIFAGNNGIGSMDLLGLQAEYDSFTTAVEHAATSTKAETTRSSMKAAENFKAFNRTSTPDQYITDEDGFGAWRKYNPSEIYIYGIEYAEGVLCCPQEPYGEKFILSGPIAGRLPTKSELDGGKYGTVETSSFQAFVNRLEQMSRCTLVALVHSHNVWVQDGISGFTGFVSGALSMEDRGFADINQITICSSGLDFTECYNPNDEDYPSCCKTSK